MFRVNFYFDNKKAQKVGEKSENDTEPRSSDGPKFVFTEEFVYLYM